MLIGELSKRSGFSRDTIRYYEKIGLIELPAARREHNYKDYPEEVLQQLNAIRKYKELGYTLEEIRELLVLQSIKVLDIARMLAITERKIMGVDTELERLHNIRLKLGRQKQSLLKKKTGHIIELPELKAA